MILSFLREIFGFGKKVYTDTKEEQRADDRERAAAEKLIVDADNREAKRKLKERDAKR